MSAKAKKNQTEYAATYNTKTRTIKRWVSIGKTKKDPTPLDNPQEMVKWWTRNMKQRVPDNLLALAKADSPTDIPKEPVNMEGVRGLDIFENVQDLRVTLAKNKRLLDDAYNDTDDSVISLRQRNYEKCLELLRKCEQTVTEIQIQRGELVLIANVQQDLNSLMQGLRVMRNSMVKQLATKLSELPKSIIETVQNAVEQLRSKEDDLLRKSKYWKDLQDVESQLTAS